MNPLMQGMTGGVNPQAIQQVKRMMNMFRAASNPQQMLMQAAQQNPAIGTVMQMCSGKRQTGPIPVAGIGPQVRRSKRYAETDFGGVTE